MAILLTVALLFSILPILKTFYPFLHYSRLTKHHPGVSNGTGEEDASLQLVGVYGLVSCLAVLVAGAAIGRMVDTTARNRCSSSTDRLML